MSHLLDQLNSYKVRYLQWRMSCLLLCMVLGIVACKQPHVENPPSVDFHLPVVMDTFNLDSEPIEAESKSYRNYPIYYLGPQTDTVWLRSPIKVVDSYRHLQLDWDQNKHPLADSGDVMVHVDEQTVTKQLHAYVTFGTGEAGLTANDGHPVYIINSSTDTLSIESLGSIPLTMQAKDPQGNWKSIEEALLQCGTGAKDILLPPGYIVMTIAPMFKGDFETKLRLQLGGKLVSEEFRGRISLKQFNAAKYEDE